MKRATSFKFNLSHKGNKAVVKILATSIDQAKLLIIKIENCPVSALSLITSTNIQN